MILSTHRRGRDYGLLSAAKVRNFGARFAPLCLIRHFGSARSEPKNGYQYFR